MLTYRNDSALKDAFVAEVKRHAHLDHLVKGSYGEGLGDQWRGCAVGCAAVSWAAVTGITIHPNDHAALEREGLYPEWLARLEDTLFESLPHEKAMAWPLRLSTAIPVGVNVERVKWQFCAFLMQENIDLVLRLDIPDELKSQVVDAIRGVLSVHETAITAGEWDESARSAAESAAESAARSARSARSAESAARSAESAESAARSAESARSAARSAWSARSAAESAAWSAESAAYERHADKLIELLVAAGAQLDTKRSTA